MLKPINETITIDDLTEHRRCQQELELQIRSNRTFIYLVTHEEQRIVDALKALCVRDGAANQEVTRWKMLEWDIASGVTCADGYDQLAQGPLDQQQVLSWFEKQEPLQKGYLILVLKDMHKFLVDDHDASASQTDKRVARLLYNLVRSCRGKRKVVVITGANLFLPTELERQCAVIDWPLPETAHISQRVERILESIQKNAKARTVFKTTYSAGEMEEIVRACQGMTLTQIEAIVNYQALKENKLDPILIAHEKRRIIRKSGILEWIEVSEDMNNVGGLHGLKYWLDTRKSSFTAEAKAYGLPANPKGLLLVGVQGCGKSLAAQAIAHFWNLPLLRLDMGKVFSGVVGSSEENIRSVIKIAESVAPSVLWIDEMEKGVSGSASSNYTDGGTSSRVLGSLLTWMQEKQKPTFVVATANDVSQLPPELLRKGRFDEIFFVDLPSPEDRSDIFQIHLLKRQRDPAKFDLKTLAISTDNFTGAEIEAAVISAMYESFDDNRRELVTADIVNAANETKPLAVIMKEKVEALREWANNRTRNACTLPPSSLVNQRLSLQPAQDDNNSQDIRTESPSIPRGDFEL